MERVNWDAIGATGEIVGALAVLVTLFYLILQLRENQRDVHSQNFHRVANSFNDLNRMIAADPALSRILNEGLVGFSEMTDVEKTQFGMIFLTSFRVYDSLYYQIQRGTGDLELWKGELGTLEWFCSTSGVRDWWETNTFRFSPQFNQLIDGMMKEKAPPN